MKNLIVLILSILVFVNYTSAQCGAGEVEITIDVHTDQYGYEGYWELVPAGNNCGAGTIFSGGNGLVGCNGGGDQTVAPGNGYGNNQTYNEGPWCLTSGSSYKIVYVDDYADGGFEFEVYANGYKIGAYVGSGAGNSWTFTAAEPVALDGEMIEISTLGFSEMGDIPVKGIVKNKGQNTWTSIELAYSIDNGTPTSQVFSGLNVANDETFAFQFPAAWVPANPGDYELKVTIMGINGTSDMNNANDEMTKDISVTEGIPNIIDYFFTESPQTIEIVNSTNNVNTPRDLDFHPDLSKKQLWVLNKGTENSGGSTVIIDGAGEPSQSSQLVKDGNAWHFMSLPTAIAFGENTNFATSPGVQDANHQGGTFTGPTLWSSDLSIYGVVGNPSNASFNGSHLDMLHGSPYSMGIAHEKDNAYWVFDSYNNDIVRYDFVEDHGPGQDYHGDAIVRRYTERAVQRTNAHIPCHMVLDKKTNWLYVADNSNGTVFRMDITSGNKKVNLNLINEVLAEHSEWENVTYQDVITGLTSPSGIDLIDDRLIVGDYQTGEIKAYDISGQTASLVGTLSTNASELMGIKVGPEGHIWYVDADNNTVSKIEIEVPEDTTVNVGIKGYTREKINIFPSPATTVVNVEFPEDLGQLREITIMDISGRIFEQFIPSGESVISLTVNDLRPGRYLLKVQTDNKIYSSSFMKM